MNIFFTEIFKWSIFELNMTGFEHLKRSGRFWYSQEVSLMLIHVFFVFCKRTEFCTLQYNWVVKPNLDTNNVTSQPFTVQFNRNPGLSIFANVF